MTARLLTFVKRWRGIVVWSHVAVVVSTSDGSYVLVDLVSSRGPGHLRSQRSRMRFGLVRRVTLSVATAPSEVALADAIDHELHDREVLPQYTMIRVHAYDGIDARNVEDALRWQASLAIQRRFKYRATSRSCMTFGAEFMQRLGLPITPRQLVLMDADGAAQVLVKTSAGNWEELPGGCVLVTTKHV